MISAKSIFRYSALWTNKLTSLFVSLGFTLLLAACSSSPIPEQNFYVLQSDSQAKITEISGQPNVSIRHVKLPSYLNQQGIARQLNNGQINVSFSELWAEKLSQAIPNLLAESIETSILSPVEINPLPPGITVDTLIEVNITQFIGDQNQLLLKADYRLIKPKALQSYNFLTTIPLADTRTQTLVAAYSTAIHQLSAEIAEQL